MWVGSGKAIIGTQQVSWPCLGLSQPCCPIMAGWGSKRCVVVVFCWCIMQLACGDCAAVHEQRKKRKAEREGGKKKQQWWNNKKKKKLLKRKNGRGRGKEEVNKQEEEALGREWWKLSHEAVGVITAVGPGLTDIKVGDVVAYAGNPMGSYAEEQILPASVVVPVPPSIDPVVAASVVLKGMTVQYLVRRCFKVERGHTVLVHAAAGGVGSLLCQWALSLGATVIGTVSNEAKAAQAVEDGCHHVIVYTKEDFVSSVNKITSGRGVNVVYDSVGKDTFQGSLACLKCRGYMVSFGQSSGISDPVSLSALAPKSLFLTRPSLMQYNESREELLECAGEVFAKVGAGLLKVRVNHRYPLSRAAQAHADLESRKTTGSVVFIPDSDYE
ncbi:hypothetical protein ACLOJK_041730 [Asimina triloba]